MAGKQPKRFVLCVAMAAAVYAVGFSSPAQAVDCATDFSKLMQRRQSLITQINTLNKSKATPAQACPAFSRLVAADQETIAWIKTNKDWCQIPDEVENGLKQQAGQSSSFRGKICKAAAQMKQMEQGGPRPGAPAAGSGVKLPQGAL